MIIKAVVLAHSQSLVDTLQEGALHALRLARYAPSADTRALLLEVSRALSTATGHRRRLEAVAGR